MKTAKAQNDLTLVLIYLHNDVVVMQATPVLKCPQEDVEVMQATPILKCPRDDVVVIQAPKFPHYGVVTMCGQSWH
jgi:hypothetical protein